jgi:hypothetical protein
MDPPICYSVNITTQHNTTHHCHQFLFLFRLDVNRPQYQRIQTNTSKSLTEALGSKERVGAKQIEIA